jgi:predicted nucleic acid-binding protein
MNDNQSYFLDSNIWLYAFLKKADKEKAKIANSLIEHQEIVISTQVINEVCVNLIKKSSFNEEKVQQLIEDFYQGCKVIQFDKTILFQASLLRQEYCLSFWDSLIVACACKAEVNILYAEDMQNGLIVRQSLTIINPFI